MNEKIGAKNGNGSSEDLTYINSIKAPNKWTTADGKPLENDPDELINSDGLTPGYSTIPERNEKIETIENPFQRYAMSLLQRDFFAKSKKVELALEPIDGSEVTPPTEESISTHEEEMNQLIQVGLQAIEKWESAKTNEEKIAAKAEINEARVNALIFAEEHGVVEYVDEIDPEQEPELYQMYLTRKNATGGEGAENNEV